MARRQSFVRPLAPSIYASIGFVKGTRPFVSSDPHETSHSSSSGPKLGGALSIAKWATSNDHCAFIFGKKEMRLGDFIPGRELSARAEALSFRLLIVLTHFAHGSARLADRVGI